MFRPWENREVQQNGPFQDQEEMGPDEQVEELSYDETQRKRKRHLHSDAKELIFNVHQSLVRRGCCNPIREASDLLQLPYTTVQTILHRRTIERKRRLINIPFYKVLF
jgi:hypothetical protein